LHPETSSSAIVQRIPLWLKLAYSSVWISALTGIIFLPTHLLLKNACSAAGKDS